jgi:hypothetical protein
MRFLADENFPGDAVAALTAAGHDVAWRAGLPAPCGIVLFRLPMASPNDAGRVIAAILDARSDWQGQFSVVEPGRVRMRQLPKE